MAACAASLMIQGIPRNSHGETRVSVGKLEAGEGRNVIPAHAKLQMEVRGETMAVNQFMADYVYDIFAGVDKAYRVKSTVTKAGESETLMPCPEIYPVLEKVMAKIPGTKLLPRVHSGPKTARSLSDGSLSTAVKPVLCSMAATIMVTIARISRFRMKSVSRLRSGFLLDSLRK